MLEVFTVPKNFEHFVDVAQQQLGRVPQMMGKQNIFVEVPTETLGEKIIVGVVVGLVVTSIIGVITYFFKKKKRKP